MMRKPDLSDVPSAFDKFVPFACLLLGLLAFLQPGALIGVVGWLAAFWYSSVFVSLMSRLVSVVNDIEDASNGR